MRFNIAVELDGLPEGADQAALEAYVRGAIQGYLEDVVPDLVKAAEPIVVRVMSYPVARSLPAINVHAASRDDRSERSLCGAATYSISSRWEEVNCQQCLELR
jgi:hypothetical protein